MTFYSISGFNGSVDGNNKTISNITISGQGIFTSYDKVNIKDLTIENPSMTTTTSGYVGVLAGTVTNSTITNVKIVSTSSENPITIQGTQYIGGLVGYITNSTIIDSSVSSNFIIKGTTNPSYVGGLTGYTTATTIQNSSSRATVTATGSYSGGLIGYATEITINNSYAGGQVSGTAMIGGLIGNIGNSTNKSI